MREPPKLLLPIALALVVCGCGDKTPNYRDAQLRVDMSDKEIRSKFGEPDAYNEGWSETPDGGRMSRTRDATHQYHVERLAYGPMPDDKYEDDYQMELVFVEGKLKKWKKSIGDE